MSSFDPTSITETRRGPSPMMWLSIGLGVAMATVLIVIVSLLTGGAANATFTPESLNGTKIPALNLPGLSAGTVNGPWTSGHPAVVVFYASWCQPCNEELPRVATWEKTHDLGRVRFIGIDSNDERSKGLAFSRKARVAFPSGFDANGTQTSGTFQFAALPDTVFINSRGVVQETVIGAVSNEQLSVGVSELN